MQFACICLESQIEFAFSLSFYFSIFLSKGSILSLLEMDPITTSLLFVSWGKKEERITFIHKYSRLENLPFLPWKESKKSMKCGLDQEILCVSY